MAQRRVVSSVSFPHADEGVVLINDETDYRDRKSLQSDFGFFRSCAVLAVFMMIVITALLVVFGTNGIPILNDLKIPDPIAEQAKIVKAHEYTVIRKAHHDGKVGAEGSLIEPLPEPPKSKLQILREEQKVAAVAMAKVEKDEESHALEELRATAEKQVASIRDLKATGVVLETDADAKTLIAKTQNSLRALLRKEYGRDGPYYVEMKLTFPETMPDYVSAGGEGTIIIEMAPIALVPYVVYYFLEIVKHFKSGAFHRNAGHVLQSMVSVEASGERRGLAWQEYDAGFPHKKLTVGYAGRPGGPAFYISTVDNTDNHGPASQGSKTEADGCFGKIVKGEDVVKRMTKQPGKSKPAGFVNDAKNFIKITSLTLLPKGQKIVFDPKE